MTHYLLLALATAMLIGAAETAAACNCPKDKMLKQHGTVSMIHPPLPLPPPLPPHKLAPGS